MLSSGELRYSGALGWLGTFSEWAPAHEGQGEEVKDYDVNADNVENSIPRRPMPQIIASQTCLKELRSAFHAFFRSVGTTYYFNELDMSNSTKLDRSEIINFIRLFVTNLPRPVEVHRLPVNGHVDLLTPSSWTQLLRSSMIDIEQFTISDPSHRAQILNFSRSLNKHLMGILHEGHLPTFQLNAIEAVRGLGMFNYVLRWGPLKNQAIQISGITAHEIDSSVLPWPSADVYRDQNCATTLELARVPDRPHKSSFTVVSDAINSWFTYVSTQPATSRGSVLLMDAPSLNTAVTMAEKIASNLLQLSLWDAEQSNHHHDSQNSTMICIQCAKLIRNCRQVSRRPVVVVLSSNLAHELMISGLSSTNAPSMLLTTHQYNIMESNFLDFENYCNATSGGALNARLSDLCRALSLKDMSSQLSVLPGVIGVTGTPPHSLLCGLGLSWQVLMAYSIEDVIHLVASLPPDIPMIVLDSRPLSSHSDLLNIVTKANLNTAMGDGLLITTPRNDQNEFHSKLMATVDVKSCPCHAEGSSPISVFPLHRASYYESTDPLTTKLVVAPDDSSADQRYDVYEDNWLLGLNKEREQFKVQELKKQKLLQAKLRESAERSGANDVSTGVTILSEPPIRSTVYGAVYDHLELHVPPIVSPVDWHDLRSQQEGITGPYFTNSHVKRSRSASHQVEDSIERNQKRSKNAQQLQSPEIDRLDNEVVEIELWIMLVDLESSVHCKSSRLGMHDGVETVIQISKPVVWGSMPTLLPKHGRICKDLPLAATFDVTSSRIGVFGSVWDKIVQEFQISEVTRVAVDIVSPVTVKVNVVDEDARQCMSRLWSHYHRWSRLLSHISDSFWTNIEKRNKSYSGIRPHELSYISPDFIQSEVMRITGRRLAMGNTPLVWGRELFEQSTRNASTGFIKDGLLIHNNFKVQSQLWESHECKVEGDLEKARRIWSEQRRILINSRWS
eukprot:GHVH01000231.1.p1 GENE.GHVH01000231.1~~GHVH01000231.1.p1  ORF type:complete len:1081 (+),score=141.14 GHVH01000231.1:371-3244(+)